MRYIAVGSAAFLLAGLFDLAALHDVPRLKQVFGLAGVAVFGYALTMLVLHPVKLQVPSVVSYVGLALAALSVLLLIYSLFLEIPFRPTYAQRGAGRELITTGTYALVRHPGVIWLTMLLVGLVLTSRSYLLCWATPLWVALDAIYVWAQEKWLLGKLFPAYDQYCEETPMLIPTRESIVRCWRTMLVRRRVQHPELSD